MFRLKEHPLGRELEIRSILSSSSEKFIAEAFGKGGLKKNEEKQTLKKVYE